MESMVSAGQTLLVVDSDRLMPSMQGHEMGTLTNDLVPSIWLQSDGDIGLMELVAKIS